ncbi:hypothetical protein SODALDRAFT_112130 [Sodiomyces alkalinus F11]|uniref:Chromo domain-containing protein n=1 Tax=Sodiomyces alkalinus (strain CBS 110278 / VKM F-3762 / F11) TaxID=1314773 RepID=A0A3N2Q2Z8_SODAK|nr:hypothetical protein SODALDRAFT_112130 [Sodiomyces alkalinus F11]ROT41112.1 hypothetical protein SODALDRAFT_112130 [Sodiomyces alkalinus F11]
MSSSSRTRYARTPGKVAAPAMPAKAWTLTVELDKETYCQYRPGRRRLAPITLLPTHDSQATIVEEYIVRPENSRDGQPHREYLITWPDLPTTRITVDAAEIRDYVSAREYERWNEVQAEARERAELAQEEAENVRAVEEALRREREEELAKRGILLRSGLLGSSRDNSVEMHTRSASREGRREEYAPSKKKGRPNSEADDEHIIREQLEDLGGWDDSRALNSECLLAMARDELTLTTSEAASRASSRLRHLEPPRKKQRTISPVPLQLGGPSRHQPTDTWAFARGASEAAPPSESIRRPARSSPTPRAQKNPGPGTPTTSGRLLTTTVSAPAKSLRETSRQPDATPRPRFTPLAVNSSRWTTVSNPSKSGKTPTPKPAAQDSSSTQKQRSKKKPTPRAKQSDADEAEGKDEGGDGNEGDPVYEVERLEATKVLMIGGEPVRHFLVRWKGDWSPDENPTWEPEDNIPAGMARRFLKKAKGLGLDGASDAPGASASRAGLWTQRKWSSVSEAFAGNVDDEEDGHGSDKASEQRGDDGFVAKTEKDDGDYGDELLLVTDDGSNTLAPISGQSVLSWELAMGRRFGDETGMVG